MLAVDNIGNQLKTVLQPLPKPAPKPIQVQAATADSRAFEQKNIGAQVRNKIERLAADNFQPATQPSQAEILKIAQDSAPILVLPQSNSGFEKFFERFGLPNVSQSNLLADPLEYIKNSRLREDVTAPVTPHAPDLNPFNGWGNPLPISIHTESWTGQDKNIGDNTNGNSGDDFSPGTVADYPDDKYFLDLDNGKRGTLGSENAPVHYQFQSAANGEPPKITYHFFYAYNDAPKGTQVPIDFNHEGDWERVTYELDPKTFKPVKAILSAHEGGSTYDIADLQKDGATGRPLIYVANGSHANYATAGDQPITTEILGQKIEISYDRTSGVNDAVKFDTGKNLREVTSQSWYPNSGGGIRWGEIGESEHSSGPQGPSEDKGAVGE